MSELTSTARIVMEVFRYFRIKGHDSLSTKLLLSRKYLWRDVEEETFNKAMAELAEKDYIRKMEDPEGWQLLDAGAEYLKTTAKERR